MKNWIEPIFHYYSTHQKIFVITPEEIIRTIILQASGLTEQNLRDFENRPKGIMHNQLMMQAPRLSKKFWRHW